MAGADLGNLFYDMHRYAEAQPLLAEAVPALHTGTPGLAITRRRSDAADELAIHAGNVQLQDSLLRLAAMPPEQQLEIARHLAAEHRRKLREAENAVAQQNIPSPSAGIAVIPVDGAAAQPLTFTLNTDRSWYFYNPALVRPEKWSSNAAGEDGR